MSIITPVVPYQEYGTTDTQDNRKRGKYIEHIACPLEGCSSSDGMAVYLDEDTGTENGYCWRCERYTEDPRDLVDQADEQIDEQVKGTRSLSNNASGFGLTVANTDSSYLPKVTTEDGKTYPVRELADRHISQATAAHFGVRVGVSPIDGETPLFTLFPRYVDDVQVGWKTKSKDKKYCITGGGDVALFGQWACKSSGKKLWITEGEEDAMSLFEALKSQSSFDWNPDVVSLPDGAGSCIKAISRNIYFVDSFDEIILVLDNDAAGIDARKQLCKILAGKVSYVNLPLKDANEMAVSGRQTELKWLALQHAIPYQPDGVVTSDELWDKYNSKKDVPSFNYPEFLSELQRMTLGLFLPSIVTFAAGTGAGKTQTLRELLYHFWSTTNEKIAGMFLEEDVSDTVNGILSLHLNSRLTLSRKNSTEEQIEAAFDTVFRSDRIHLYDYFGGMDDSNLLSKLKYFAITGHRLIFLDHLSIIVSEYAAAGGERERIDTLMTKLAKFVKEFNVCLIDVVHLKKAESSRESFELGARPTLDDLRGSASIKQLSWDVIFATRNQQHPDPFCRDVIEFSVGKCRKTGCTGTADYVWFNKETGRYEKVIKPLNFRLPKGSKYNNDEEYDDV